MDKISVIGLDLAKNVFQVHGVDNEGEVVVHKQLKRSQVRRFFANLAPCMVGMEACGGAHYWSRELTELGHTVRMMAPVFVKPYLRGLLIQGARNVIYHIRRRLRAGQPGGNAWVEQLLQRSHPNAVAVALANKMAGIAWVLLVRNQTWCPAVSSERRARTEN